MARASRDSDSFSIKVSQTTIKVLGKDGRKGQLGRELGAGRRGGEGCRLMHKKQAKG